MCQKLTIFQHLFVPFARFHEDFSDFRVKKQRKLACLLCFRREENRNFWAKYSYAFICISLSFLDCETNTVKPLKTDTPRDKQKYPSYRGVRLIEVIFNRNFPLGLR